MAIRIALAAIMLALLAYLGWSHFLSPGARVEAAYRGCMKEIATLPGGAQGAKPTEGPGATGALAKGLNDAVGSMLQGLGGVMCETIRDACARDFNGQVCQAARKRFG
jgi:hypothetical protein